MKKILLTVVLGVAASAVAQNCGARSGTTGHAAGTRPSGCARGSSCGAGDQGSGRVQRVRRRVSSSPTPTRRSAASKPLSPSIPTAS